MAKAKKLVRTRGTVEPHPRGGWQGVIYEGEKPQKWICPHRHRTEATAVQCTYATLKAGGL